MRLATLALLVSLGVPLAPAAHAQDGGAVLVFSRTTGFRHASIPNGIAAVRQLGETHGFSVTATEAPSVFSAAGLAPFDAVVFLNTTGDILDASQQAAFEGYIQSGGGFVGVHSAADTEYDWAWYGGLVGAYFESHPPGTPDAVVHVADRVHPATRDLPASWARTDEWYNFRRSPRGDVHVLATLDEQTYSGGTMLGDHPIAWCQAYEGGRSFYTAGGHTGASFAEVDYLGHLWGGLAWAAGWAPGDCSATVETSWEISTLDGDVNDPMELAVAPDGRVFVAERGGTVKVWDPQTSVTRVAASLPVTTSFEDGLLGITLDPAFETTGWAYLYYSPAGSEPIQRLSRFSVVGDAIDLGSESVLLTVRTDRDQGGHSGGSLAFGPDGLLYVATGDDTDPFDSDGYAPIDERPGRESWDAQRTSGNPFDLRGKILRVRPLADGTAEIPEGNLFAADGSEGRPEVYAMGLRNPFRISLDPDRGWLYWGDVGPDAGSGSSARGPRGYDEVNQARSAGFFGWPYCTADNQPYRDYNFATGSNGPAFDCSDVVNDSPNVDEAPVALPPAVPAWAWYPYAPSPEFPDLPNGGGRTAMAGPVVSASTPGGAALPAYFDGSVFVYEWSRNWIVETHLDADGQPLAFQRFLPSLDLNRPIDLELGPDGAFYVIEWGSGFGGGNPDAALRRIAYTGGSRSPIASAQASATSGPAPLTVAFSSTGTVHPDGLPLTYAWDLNGDDAVDATTPTATWTYAENGSYTARLTVTDTNDRAATATVPIVVGNSEPVVTAALPADGGFFAWGDSLRYDVSVTDLEDGSTEAGTIACADVVIQPGIGHDDHNHPLEEYPGCEGGFRTPGGHGADGENVFVVVDARYADAGAEGVGSLTGRRQVVLRPNTLEAEHYSSQSGVVVASTEDWSGALDVAGIDDGDWVAYDPVHLGGVPFVTARVSLDGSGGRVEFRADAPDGPLLASARVSPTTEGMPYRDVTVPIEGPDETITLYLVFRSDATSSGLFDLNWVRFHGTGAAVAEGQPRGLVAEYFPSPDLSGEPVTRTDPQVSFDWGTDAPIEGLPTNGFSVRWRGLLSVPADGRYRFTTATDDGARLWVDGVLVVDAWEDTGLRRASGSATLPAGDVPIRLEYRDDSRLAEAALLWTGPNVPFQTVPEALLTADPTVETNEEVAPVRTVALGLPHPNPADRSVEVEVRVAAAGHATVEVFDALGRRVLQLHDGPLAAGVHTLAADVSALPSGVYGVRMSAGEATDTRWLTVVR
ncbi:ThuA domain-containing protein [Rubrivirga marina]|uniref:PKD domain-containing protein n=1 Tax=Rubrivirga marina TaxID=1196024 RepID=A0A271J2D8_9BACT|nr:ThuA domain-containing protein [Rubrivirga marina]PAP77125.1 hypothetical protein BSZ37_12155 [Rubrivirga marina]